MNCLSILHLSFYFTVSGIQRWVTTTTTSPVVSLGMQRSLKLEKFIYPSFLHQTTVREPHMMNHSNSTSVCQGDKHKSHLMPKPTKWHVHPAKTQISLMRVFAVCMRRLRPAWASTSLIRVFAVRLKKAWVLSYPLSTQRRLSRLGDCPGWSESSLGAHVSLLVLSCGCSIRLMLEFL